MIQQLGNNATAAEGTASAERSAFVKAFESNVIGDFAATKMGLLLWGLQSPINTGMILRIAEAYHFSAWSRDSFGVLADAEKRKTIGDFSCGALDRRGITILPEDFRASSFSGRIVATTIEGETESLEAFQFLPGDVIALGNEYDGLPAEFCEAADVRLRIPMAATWMPKAASSAPIDSTRQGPAAREGQPSLNVAISAGIICFAAYAGWLRSLTGRETVPLP